jgi:carboxypeptidase Taq
MPAPLSSPADAAWATITGAAADLHALRAVLGLLQWDQETHMPPAGAAARGEQLAALEAAVHERLTAPALADALAAAEETPPADPDRAAALRVLRRDQARAAAVPAALVRAIALAQSRGLQAWRAARAARAFGPFAGALAELVALRREQAAALRPVLVREAGPGAPAPEAYDALLDQYEPGMRVATLEPLLARLTGWLAPLLDTVTARPPADRSFLSRPFDAEAQWRFSLELLGAIGFDLGAGRQDRSIHPFCCGIDPGDVRLTNRLDPGLPLSPMFSALHEGGHGLYEQHLPAALRGLGLCAAASAGLHESQSRLWENLVGRSLPFWRAMLPRAQAHFPQLAGVAPERFFRAANAVERSHVRVEADEVSYNLHIALRFELELALVRGELDARELPAAWSERSERLLGLRPPDDLLGVLQDIHWSTGELGYFPTYTVGNLYSATLLAAARRALPDLDEAVGRGELAPLREWLSAHVHGVGRRKVAEEIVRDATGAGLTDRDFREYLEGKYLRELA